MVAIRHWRDGPTVIDRETVSARTSASSSPTTSARCCGPDAWAARDAWQFPARAQREESPRTPCIASCGRRSGCEPEHVQVLACTRGWLRYRLPRRMLRRNSTPSFVGQKQKWFLLRMLGPTTSVRFDASEEPEFDHWRWVSYWYPLGQVVSFKRDVYRRALAELAMRLPVAEGTEAGERGPRGSDPSSGRPCGRRVAAVRARRRPHHTAPDVEPDVGSRTRARSRP